MAISISTVRGDGLLRGERAYFIYERIVQKMTPLNSTFFARPTLEVAPDLLGTLLVHEQPSGNRLVGRVVDEEKRDWPIATSARIGLHFGIDWPYRFFVKGHRFVSPGVPSDVAARARRAKRRGRKVPENGTRMTRIERIVADFV